MRGVPLQRDTGGGRLLQAATGFSLYPRHFAVLQLCGKQLVALRRLVAGLFGKWTLRF
jgi:hypothetical protein